MVLFKTGHWTRRIVILIVLTAMLAANAALGLAQEAFDQDIGKVPHQDGEAFQIGSSCAAMAYLEQAQLQYLMNPVFKEEFQSFCYPEEPFDCSDYVALLRGLATLEAGLDGYYCKLLLK